jgi:hypothetical protein
LLIARSDIGVVTLWIVAMIPVLLRRRGVGRDQTALRRRRASVHDHRPIGVRIPIPIAIPIRAIPIRAIPIRAVPIRPEAAQ